jgi:hypothetical protein
MPVNIAETSSEASVVSIPARGSLTRDIAAAEIATREGMLISRREPRQFHSP